MISLATPDLQPFAVFLGDDTDGAIFSVGEEIGRLVGDEVTAANQIVEFIKRLVKREHITGKHGFAATPVG